LKQGKDYIGVGCGAFILNEKEELLLQQRNKSPEKGCWCIPGGKVELFETFEEAVKRETKEETGVDINVIDELGICDHIIKDEGQHWVSPSFLCQITKGEPKIMEPTKHTDMKWFSLENLPENLTITTRNAIKNYQKYKEKAKGKEEKICQLYN
jgi:mutator protein MutT